MSTLTILRPVTHYWIFEYAINNTMHVILRKHFFKNYFWSIRFKSTRNSWRNVSLFLVAVCGSWISNWIKVQEYVLVSTFKELVIQGFFWVLRRFKPSATQEYVVRLWRVGFRFKNLSCLQGTKCCWRFCLKRVLQNI